MKLWLDLETFNEADIRVGTHRYAETVEIMVVAYAIDDGPVTVLDIAGRALGSYCADFFEALALADEVWAHNSHFDRTMIRHVWPEYCPELPRWRDTMVQAYAHGLPGGLDKLCSILNVPIDEAKHGRGKDLVKLFCKPRPKNMGLRRATRETHPAEWAEFLAYAGNDITAMRAVQARLPNWNYKGRELDLWHLDQRINDRGVAVDLELARAAIKVTTREAERLDAEVQDRTGYCDLAGTGVESARKRDQLLAHLLEEHGVELPDMKGSTLERRLQDETLPEAVKALLRLRLDACTTSTAKYKSLVKSASSDSRLRGTLQFCGAQRTGRWAGRMFQPQNLPRVPKSLVKEVPTAIEAIKADAADLLYPNVMEISSACIRGCLVAPQGRKLVVADLSNIEGRMLAWLARESWKLAAFAAFDLGKGHDLYKIAYGKSFGVRPEDVDGDQRQLGKVQELALGYEGGVGAFVSMGAVYGVDMNEAYTPVWNAADFELQEAAIGMWKWALKKNRTLGLTQEAYIASEIVKRAWRQANPNIVQFWADLQKAVQEAILYPKTLFTVGYLKIRRDGAWLRIGLPSGRALCYPAPQVDDGQISYMGINQYTKKWQRLKTYGGKLAENVTQAGARDVIGNAMPIAEGAGYELVLTVHDELITEAPDSSEFNVKHLSSLLSTVPDWAPGLPLAAAGFEDYRYRKE